ncbi:helix-turn-helix transcriptional regulator [Amycolatopsis palatopharyngis]|uniref:helix-turn-helix transcriptional regulator n=1 Tax=Amycolatopsis palatopharyngis TaxID=187982 RepID=UPI001FEC5F2A|nr:AraC family transcriptional regulator [Amycolatopsis palatopharyngis]
MAPVNVHGLTRFRTSDLPDGHKLAGWEAHNARSLVGLRARPLGDGPFEGTEVNLRLPQLQLAKVSGSPHVVDRDIRQIATHPADGVAVYFALAGEGCFYHRNGCEMLSPGQGLVCDADQPFQRGFTRGLTELVLKAPRAALRETVGRSGLARPHVFTFGGGDHGQGAAHAHALAATVADALAGARTDWDALQSTVLELLAALLGAGASAGSNLAAAHAYIAAHLHEPELSAGRIAVAIGYSERQLSRLFAESGQSVPQTVLAARLDAVRRAFADPAHARTPLAELAAQHGFASQAHFSRAYRARFGTTPRSDRGELLAPP